MLPNWTVSNALSVLNQATQQLGLSYSNIELLRFGTAATYRLLPQDIVARVIRPGAKPELIEKEQLVVSTLQQKGFPVIPLVDGLPAILVGDSYVTFMKYLPPSNEPVSTFLFGELIKNFHTVSNDAQVLNPDSIGYFKPFDDINNLLANIENSQNIAYTDIQLLKSWRDFLIHRFNEEITDPNYSTLGFGVIHGDAHIGNAYRSDGGVYLLDFDYTSFGPREWDLIPMALAVRRFGDYPNNYYQFVKSYGFDVASWPGFETLALIRELFVTIWRLDMETSSVVHQESQNRLQYWRGVSNPPVWKSF